MRKTNENIVKTWRKYYKKNYYYHSDYINFLKNNIPPETSVLEIGSKSGEVLNALPNKTKYGVELAKEFTQTNSNKKIKIYNVENFTGKLKGAKFDYIIITHTFSETTDIQELISQLKIFTHEKTRIIVVYFNFFWKPLFGLAESMGIKKPSYKEPNWLTSQDIKNLFYLESFEAVKEGKRFLFPFALPPISSLINKYISQLPLINSFCMIEYLIFKPITPKKNYSVSVIIPAKNEEGNIPRILNKIPFMGTGTEILFVEGGSKDKTFETINKEIKRYKGKISARVIKQKGRGKADAVRLGFANAKNELLIIFDADLTINPKELIKFYEAVSQGKAELAIGSRLVFPMPKQAMRTLNYFGNKIFSSMFSYLLGQKIKDTLCGTKALLKEDYFKIVDARKEFEEIDPFGDFDLIFGASKLNLKILEIPVPYKQRLYGQTNISRFSNGLMLLKMVFYAAKNLKFI